MSFFPSSALRRAVFGIGDVLQPVDMPAVERFLHGEVLQASLSTFGCEGGGNGAGGAFAVGKGISMTTSSSVSRPSALATPEERSAMRPVRSFGPQSTGEASIDLPVLGLVTLILCARSYDCGVFMNSRFCSRFHAGFIFSPRVRAELFDTHIHKPMRAKRPVRAFPGRLCVRFRSPRAPPIFEGMGHAVRPRIGEAPSVGWSLIQQAIVPLSSLTANYPSMGTIRMRNDEEIMMLPFRIEDEIADKRSRIYALRAERDNKGEFKVRDTIQR